MHILFSQPLFHVAFLSLQANHNVFVGLHQSAQEVLQLTAAAVCFCKHTLEFYINKCLVMKNNTPPFIHKLFLI